MSSTDPADAAGLALALFDDKVIRLAADMRAGGQPGFFPLAGESGAESYFEAPTQAFMGLDDFAFPGEGTPEGLIDALAAYWTGRGEDGLAALAPQLKPVAAALRAETSANDGQVDILCYTMF
jgi:hypothetical protein